MRTSKTPHATYDKPCKPYGESVPLPPPHSTGRLDAPVNSNVTAMISAPLAEFDGQLLDGLYFCSRVYTLFEAIRNLPEGRSRLRLRPTRVEKKLLEELLPIAKFIQANYRPGRYIGVRWKDGNQNHDAELHQDGAYVTKGYYTATAFLEVVSAVHPKDHLSRELLDTEGGTFGLDGIRRLKSGKLVSEPVGYSSRNFIPKFSEILLKQLRAKAAKVYPPDTSLIVQATLNLPYMPDEWLDLIAMVQASLPRCNFREIYVLGLTQTP